MPPSRASTRGPESALLSVSRGFEQPSSRTRRRRNPLNAYCPPQSDSSFTSSSVSAVGSLSTRKDAGCDSDSRSTHGGTETFEEHSYDVTRARCDRRIDSCFKTDEIQRSEASGHVPLCDEIAPASSYTSESTKRPPSTSQSEVSPPNAVSPSVEDCIPSSGRTINMNGERRLL